MTWRSDPSDPAPADVPVRRTDPPWWSRRTEWAIYLLAGVTYIGFGIFHKWLLNWIIGPLWLVAWVWLLPTAIEAVRRRRAA